MKPLVIIALGVCVTATALAGEQKPATSAKVIGKPVFITGSFIPQRVQVRPVGTTTVSPVRIINRREIDGTGRVTTPGAFVNDPSVNVIGH